MASVRHLGLFPFCVPHETPSEQPFPNIYPVGLSKEDAMLWFWRVKKAEVTRFLNFQIEGEPPPQPDTELVQVVYSKEGQEFFIETEKEIICFTENTGFSFEVSRSGQEANFGFFPFGGFQNIIKSMIFNAEENLFYPRILGSYGAEYPNLNYNSNSKTFYSELYDNGSYIQMTAFEFYPYDPGDGGGPIYDSATGQQLRPSPPN